MPETTTTSKLPSVPEEVTTEWLSSVLKLPIKSSEITKTILNQTASKVYVTLTYEDGPAGNDRPEHVCLKGGTASPRQARPPWLCVLLTIRQASTRRW